MKYYTIRWLKTYWLAELQSKPRRIWQTHIFVDFAEIRRLEF